MRLFSSRKHTLILFALLCLILVLLPGCGSQGTSSHSQGSSALSARDDEATADEATADESTDEETTTTTIKCPGIKPFWTYTENAIGGGGKALANLWGGNFMVQYTDLAFPGRGLPVELRRTYNSQVTAQGFFGKGWTSIFDTHLIFNESTGKVVLVDAYGGRFAFTPIQTTLDEIIYRAPAGRNTIFKKLADGTYTEKKKNGSTYIFNSEGKLVRLQHRNTKNLQGSISR